MIAVDGAELHVDVSGDGVPVVFVHGLGLSGELWNRMRRGFGTGYQVVLVDLRGAGRSRERDRGELTLARWADDLDQVVRSLELERPVVVGHSLGASVVLRYALEHPGEAGALVLIVPLLKPMLLFAIVIAIIANFQVFDTVYVLTQGGPYESTSTLVWFIWKRLFQFQQTGQGYAAAVLLLAIILGLTAVSFWLLGSRRRRRPREA